MKAAHQTPAEPLTFYESKEKIYPREIGGRFQRLRNISVVALLGLYYLVPWIQWNGNQAILFDLPARKFHLFGLTIWPQDLIYLTMLLIIAAMTLFFFTTLAGRVWCGFACPQTVWTEAFVWMERWTEGNRNKQMKLDKSPWNREKIIRKSSKQFLWISFSLFTGFTFVGYFTPITELATKLSVFSTGPWETFWVFFYGFATYGNAGFMREQVCKYMCPYARFQSAMFDKDTLIISYDIGRGDPRGGRKRGSDAKEQGLGDCIDCKLCVQVCPTGIDIREGLQYECIACAACVDACDSVMEKMDYPKGLIRYTTQHALDHNVTHILRPKIMGYGLILISVFAAFIYAVATREPVGMDIIRDRNILYRELSDGQIENVYLLKIMNKSGQQHRFSLRADGIPNLVISSANHEIVVDSGEVKSLSLGLSASASDIKYPSTIISIIISSSDEAGIEVVEETRFLKPVKP